MSSYKSSIHALEELLSAHGTSYHGCQITKVSEDISHLINGVEYCFVEVSCNDGVQYGIQACGEEAIELHKQAVKYNSIQQTR